MISKKKKAQRKALKKLPNKMSELIMVAIKDLKKIEKSKYYAINMGVWHEPNGKCTVCFAGSVMAKTLGVDRRLYAYPSSFSEETRAKLEALDYLRKGEIQNAHSRMFKGKSLPPLMNPQVSIDSYRDFPEHFKMQMIQLANQLAQLGY
jgi:ribosomal protein S27AE